jgi:CRP-like cAMP-binding protein
MKSEKPLPVFLRENSSGRMGAKHSLEYLLSHPESEIWEGEKQLKRGELLSRAGETERHLYYIIKGSFRVVYPTPQGELTIRLGYSGNVLNSLPSYLSGLPGQLNIEAIKKTTVLYTSKTRIDAIINSSPEHGRSFRQMLEKLVIQQHERELDILCSSPAERYERVLQRSPGLFQEVPARYIAEYLRMTPETLSRLRKS